MKGGCKWCGEPVDDATRGQYRYYCSNRCYGAHKRKIYRKPRQSPPIPHGTLSGYARCKCADCRGAMAAYQRERRSRLHASPVGRDQREGHQ